MNSWQFQAWEDLHTKVIGRCSIQCGIQGAGNSRTVGVSGTHIRDSSNVAEVLLSQSVQVICNCGPHHTAVWWSTGGLVDGNPCERYNLNCELKECDISRQLYVDTNKEYNIHNYI